MAAAFPQSWYPLCRSSDLRPGQVRPQTAFGLRFAVYRARSGQVHALNSVCAHFGANLALGRVVGERLQCPLHHWEYDGAGRCAHIPATDEIPARARQLALPCREQYGLVYAFLGDRPLFDLPRFPAGPRPLHSAAFVMDFDTPYQVLASNSFDGQHFSTVHHRPLLEPARLESISPYHLSLAFRARVEGQAFHDRLLRAAGIRVVELSADCWGGNLILAYNARTRSHIMFNVVPLGEHQTRVFILNVFGPEAFPRWPTALRRLALAVAHRLTIAFLQPDIAVMHQLQFKLGVLLPVADHTYLEWIKYWKRLPRLTLAPSAGNGAAPDVAPALESVV